HRQSPPRYPLLNKCLMIQPQAVRELRSDERIPIVVERYERRIEIPRLVFELVSHGGLGPHPRCVIALVQESRTIRISAVDRIAVEEVEVRRITTPVSHRISIDAPRVVLEAGDLVLPMGRPSQELEGAGESVVMRGGIGFWSTQNIVRVVRIAVDLC